MIIYFLIPRQPTYIYGKDQKKTQNRRSFYKKIKKRIRKRDLGPNFAVALPAAAKYGEIEP